MKIQCHTCKTFKNIDCFATNKTKKNGVNTECKECRKIYIQKHYQENKQYYKDKTKRRVEELREWLKEFKSNLKCEKCGEDHPACIDFHHKDEMDKEFDVSKAICKGFTKERILEEIAKCIVVCSNCHRKIHWNANSGPYKKKYGG